MIKQLVQHLKKCADYHTALGEGSIRKAKICEAGATMCEKISDSSLGDIFATLGQEHADDAEIHAAHARHHLAMCKAIESGDPSIDTHSDERGTESLKAGRSTDLEKFGMFAMRDFSKVEPTRVHGALPDAPRHTLVPRPGGPPIGGEEDPTDAIDRLARAPDEIRKGVLGQ